MENYSEEEFLVTEVDFLGCNPNSHKIAIKEEVFKKYAFTVLGKFLVAKVAYGDATGHDSDEGIVGYIPSEQEVRFVRNNQGYLRGIVDGVVSKQYASEFCKIFIFSICTGIFSARKHITQWYFFQVQKLIFYIFTRFRKNIHQAKSTSKQNSIPPATFFTP